MNLLLPEDKAHITHGFLTRFWVVLFKLVTFVLVVGILMLVPTYILAQATINSQEAPALEKTDEQKANALLHTLPAEINTKLTTLESFLNNRSLSKDLYEFIALRPSGISITSFSIRKHQMVEGVRGQQFLISGIAQNRDNLVTFVDVLKASKKFSSVSVPVSNFTKEKNLPFNMQVFIPE